MKNSEKTLAYLVQNGQTLYFLDKEPESKKQTFYQINNGDNAASIIDKIHFARNYTAAQWIMFNVGTSVSKTETIDNLTAAALKKKVQEWKKAWTEWSKSNS